MITQFERASSQINCKTDQIATCKIRGAQSKFESPQLQYLFVILSMRNFKKLEDITQFGCGEIILESYISPLKVNPLPANLSQDIETLRFTAAHNRIVSLAANQILMKHRMFAVLKEPLIQVAQWNNYPSVTSTDYDIIINPQLKEESNLRLKDFQECPSLPGLRFHVWNPVSQLYHYLSPTLQPSGEIILEPKVTKLIGFKARVWDHEVRHLAGLLPIAREISHCQFSVADGYRNIPAMFQRVQVLKDQLNLMSSNNLKKVMGAKSSGKSAGQASQGFSPDEIPDKITEEMKGRLRRQYARYRRRGGQN